MSTKERFKAMAEDFISKLEDDFNFGMRLCGHATAPSKEGGLIFTQCGQTYEPLPNAKYCPFCGGVIDPRNPGGWS